MEEGWKQVWDLETTRPVVARLEVANTAWKRAVGLVGRLRFEPGQGLWLSPCNGIHTFGMRFPIDVAFLDSEGRAIKLVFGLRPWRTCGPVPGARTVLELPVGVLQAQGFEVGRRYCVLRLGPPNYPPPA